MQDPQMISELSPVEGKSVDDAFIVFASPEPRCLGIARRMTTYKARFMIVIVISDEPNAERSTNVAALREILQEKGEVRSIEFQHRDPVVGVSSVAALVAEAIANSPKPIVTVDVSTFPRNSLLLTLAAIDSLSNAPKIRLVYSEPQEYEVKSYLPTSFGLSRIAVVPSFVAPYRPLSDLILVLFLGYEGSRAMGMWQCVEPNRTIAILPIPTYRPQWEGLAESLNIPLLAGLPRSSVLHVDPRNPIATYNKLSEICGELSGKSNIYIAPLGTKPQTIGVYAFLRDFPNTATVIYTSPIEHSHAYLSKGVGDAWVLPMPGVAE